MSKVAISGNASGTGTLTIAAPNTNSNYTINLPTITGGSFIVSDTSDNVVIGTTSSTSYKLAIQSNNSNLYLKQTTGDYGSIIGQRDDDGSLTFSRRDLSTVTERMRIDASGNLLVGTTSYGGAASARFVSQNDGSTGACAVFNNTEAGTGSSTTVQFRRNATLVGTIAITGSATAYNTSSDYRLKENIQPMQNALGVVTQLKPVTYKWKADGSDGQGFIAHELQAVVPDCVTGEKNAVDAEGNPQYQGIDTSFLVATLTAAIQEQQALITQLQADVAALKGRA